MLFDPEIGVFVDCNQAAIELSGATDKQQLLRMRPEELSPPFQPDGSRSADKSAEIIAIIQKQKAYLFEWMIRRRDGRDVPIEVSATEILMGGKSIQVIISRDISERKKAERELLEMTQTLERRVTERTAELSASEARLCALVEHAPEAIVVFDGDSGRFLFGNEHACRLYGVPMERLTELTPADVSPEFQPGGRRSCELARELMDEALAGKKPVFEWLHRQQPRGRLIPTEVRLLRLPAEGQNLIRASILDNTERKRAERALRESEEKFRALFEGSSHGVVLHDENQLLEVNSAAVRLFGCQSPQELLGRHPGDLAPSRQPNGESSETLSRKYIAECLANGSARFEWLARSPGGKEIPMEVGLTRIQWSGRQVIQAYITDITERTRAQAALADSEARFSAAFQASPIPTTLSRFDDGRLVLVNDAFVSWSGYSRDEILGRNTLELDIWELREDREASWADLRRTGSLRERECSFHNRAGGRFTFLLSSEVIQLNHVPHVLSMGLDITERKQVEAELRQSEARLRESEARFSLAFQASPLIITISRVSDSRFVLVNDAFVNWSGYSREQILGQNGIDLGMWAEPDERQAFWTELRRTGSIREREYRFRNRAGRQFTMLVSSEVIQLNHVPHMLGMALDITERKRAEDALAESEARFSVAFQASPVFIGILNSNNGKFVLVNDALVGWLGCSRDEALGQSCADLGMWENLADRTLVLEELSRVGSIRQRECRWCNRRGERFTILLSAERITVDNAPHFLLLALDITQRKQAEEEMRESEARLRESEARFSVAFQASPLFIGILDMNDGRYVLANDAFLNWLGCPREEVVGRTSAEFGLWENTAERDAALNDMSTVGSIRQREVHWRNHRGELVTILLSAQSIQLNNTPHILSFAQDITRRKRAEGDLLKTLEREKELSQLKSNFVSMVSHEFRTPLGIIQSSAELLREFYQKMPPEERKDQLESITRNTRRMAGMMEEVLVLSRLDAGKLNFQPAALDLNLFCRRVVDEVLSATNRRCLIELSLNPVPSEARADEQLLGHIFTNLLSNAVKYSEPGATVHFTVERDGPDAVCVVRDQGIGISEEDQQQLFKAFHRGGNVGTRPGTGLGLLLVNRCAELHGGTVQLNSRIGEGTTVTVKLPVFGTNHEKDTDH
jgi:PAS domain S-box-containing protein